MATHHRALLLLVFLTTLIGVALAAPGDAQLEDFYIVNKDDPATGGCTPDQVEWLSSAYTEAMKMVNGAIADIDVAKAPRSVDNVDDELKWNKAASMLIQMFDITPSYLGGVTDVAQSARLAEARKVFDSLRKQANGPVPPVPEDRKVIFCNSNGVAYLGPNEPIIGGPENGKPISTLGPGADRGIIVHPGKFDDKGNLIYPLYSNFAPQSPGGPMKPQDLICATPLTFATTVRAFGRMFFCPPVFSSVKPTIAGEAGNIQTGNKLDDFYSGSRIFVHELVHLWEPIGDQIAVDSSGDPPEHGPRPKYADPKKRVWDWDRCYFLALYYPDETVNTAESFAVFASGQFFRNWRWEERTGSNGKIEGGTAWPIDLFYPGPD